MTMKKPIIAILTAILLAFTTMGGSFAFAEVAPTRAPQANKELTVGINWSMGINQRYYNTANDGKNVNIKYVIFLRGKNKANGEVEAFPTEVQSVNVTIGTNSTFTIPLGEEVRSANGKTYIEAKPISAAEIIFDEENYIYVHRIRHNVKKPYRFDLDISQNMNTNVITSIKKDAIILDKHKDNIKIKYNVEQAEEGGKVTNPLKLRNGLPIEHIGQFVDGEKLPLYRKSRSFRRALQGNVMDMYVSINGEPLRRFATYKLVASFDGVNKAELEKYYTLTVTGDDEQGWNLELGSKIKSKKDQKVEKKPFKTIYKDDPNMLAGKTKKEVKGVIGKKITEIETLYVIDDAGNEEIIETRENVISDTEPVNEVVVRGTKNPESIKDDNKKPATSDSEMLYTSIFFIIASVAAIYVASSKRKEDK